MNGPGTPVVALAAEVPDPVAAKDGSASTACPACGRPLNRFMLVLPFGLGPRTYLEQCPCEAERRAAATEERRRAEHQARVRRLLAQSGIGARHEHATFDRFEVTPASASVVDVCRRFVELFAEGGVGLTLAGPPGTGKSHLAVAITRALIDRGVSAVVANVPRLFLTFRSTFHADQPQRFDELLDLAVGCDHLVLDDLGRERPTEWVNEMLYVIVDARYAERRATTITTNLEMAALRDRLGSAIVDRLVETNRPYWCRWPSYRRPQS